MILEGCAKLLFFRSNATLIFFELFSFLPNCTASYLKPVHKQRIAVVQPQIFSSGELNLMKNYNNEANTPVITNIVLNFSGHFWSP